MDPDTESQHGLTLRFLEGFLPCWDKIKSFKVSPKKVESVKSESNGILPRVTELFVKVLFENPKKRPMNLVIKTPSELSLANCRRFKWFEKEIFFHDTLLIEFRAILSNCDPSEKSSLKLNTEGFIAGSICNVTEEPLENFVATTNLRLTRAFQSPKQLDLDSAHCQLVVKELAKLHALSWTYKKTKAVLYLEKLHPIIQETFFHEDNKERLQTLLNGIDILSSVQQVYGNESEELKTIEFLVQNGADFAEILIKFLNYQGLNENEIEKQLGLQLTSGDNEDFVEDSWAVGSHGDVRKSNLLFKYDPKNPEEPLEAALLNFHSFRECCPTMDLAYFLYTSTSRSMRESELGNLLQLYHDSFIGFCNILKKDPCPGFSIHSLQRRYQRAKIFGLLLTMLLNGRDTTDSSGVNSQGEATINEVFNGDSTDKFSGFVASAKNEETSFEALHTRLTTDIHGDDGKEVEHQRSF